MLTGLDTGLDRTGVNWAASGTTKGESCRIEENRGCGWNWGGRERERELDLNWAPAVPEAGMYSYHPKKMYFGDLL